MGPDAAFWIRTARHEATTPDSAAREGLCGAAEYPSERATCRRREPQSYRRCPGEGPAVTLQRIVCRSEFREIDSKDQPTPR